MTKDKAIELIWDYMHMHHQLKKADIIFVLGSSDARVSDYAAKLWQEGWSPWLVLSGDGRQHETALLKDAYNGETEADHMAAIAIADGIPAESIIIENRTNNTGENYEFTKPLLEARSIKIDRVIIVQKPYMERRAYATGKVWWPDTEFIVTSPPAASFDEYVAGAFDPDTILNIMIGDLQRIKEYPARGFQIEQPIPDEVWHAYEYLVEQGYTKHLLKDV